MPKLSPLARRLLAGPLAASPAPDLPAAPDGKPAMAAKRSKLWELADKHHCPVIGTCLPMAELVKFARRFRFAASLRDEFALHVEMVGHSHSRNEVSEALQRHLDRKYQGPLERFARLASDAEVRQEWQACLARGEVAGPLWAAYTHKCSSDETRQMVYGDIHMLSHQVGAGQAADARRLAHLEQENLELKDRLRRVESQAQAQIRALQRENAGLARQAADARELRADNDALGRRLEALESGEEALRLGREIQELQAAHGRLLDAAQRAEALEKALKAAQEEAGRLIRERDAAVAEGQALEHLLSTVAAGACPGEPVCQGCEGALSSGCILYVGGRSAMIAQYRQLADRLGIKLIHHDGGLEESLSRLPELIHGANAVLCPTDHISHSAYYQVKSHCKRVGKPCLFYRGAGMSSFAAAMTRISRGEFSLAGESPLAGPINRSRPSEQGLQ